MTKELIELITYACRNNLWAKEVDVINDSCVTAEYKRGYNDALKEILGEN